MVPHHEHAVEMATLAMERSSNPGVQELSQGIIATQEEELSQLEGFLQIVGAEVVQPAPEVMELNEGTIAKLESVPEAEFDGAFLEAMSAHHSSAIDMAGMEVAGGTYDDAISLAESIATTQLEEIATMQDLLAELE